VPNIPEFDAGSLALRPSETGVEARSGTARRIGMFFNQKAGAEETLARETERMAGQTQQLGRETSQLGAEKGAAMASIGRAIGSGVEAAGDAAVKYLDHEQISKGSADFTKLMMDKTQQWNDTVKNADPNDTTVGPKFLASLNQDLEDFKTNGGFVTENGQKWAEAHVDALRQHMAEKTQGDMASLAGEAVIVNHQKTINQLSATVHGDPASIDFALAALKSSSEGVIATSPNMTGTEAGKVRMELQQKGAEAIVKSAAIGYIEKTGKMPAWATDPKYASYVNGPELQMLEKAAKVQAKSDMLADKQAKLLQRQTDDLQVHAAATKTLSDNVTINPQTNEPIINPKFFKDALDIARKNPDAPSAAATARTMLDWGESQQNKERKVATDAATVADIDARMFSTDNPITKMDILRAEATGKLTRSDGEIRAKIIDQRDKMPSDPQFKLAMDGAKQLIEGRTAGEKQLQSGKYAAFMQQFLGDYQRLKAEGTLPPNALSLRDPNSLLNKSMEAYKSPMAQAISGNGGISATPFSERFTGEQSSGVQPPATTTKYNAGDVVNTSEGPRRFKGGNFRDKKNWEPVS